MSNVFQLNNVKELLLRAASKENDSSEEKHITEFLNDIISEDQYDNEDKLNILQSSCNQMKAFCELVIEKIEKDRFEAED